MSEILAMHVIEARRLSATNRKGARLVLRSLRFGCRKIFGYDEAEGEGISGKACAELSRLGYTILGVAEDEKRRVGTYFVIVGEFATFDEITKCGCPICEGANNAR